MTVRVDETKLPGATDFAVLPVMHSFMMNDAKVQRYTLNFLRRGRFVTAERPDAKQPADSAPGPKIGNPRDGDPRTRSRP